MKQGFTQNFRPENEREQELVDAIEKSMTIINAIVPIGTITGWMGQPGGEDELLGIWIVCDGREVSRADYKRLFRLISTQFGDGDGETTFNVPDLRDKAFWGGPAGSVSGNSIDYEAESYTGTPSSFTKFYVTPIIRGR